MKQTKISLFAVINAINFILVFAFNLYSLYKMIDEIKMKREANKRNKNHPFGFTKVVK